MKKAFVLVIALVILSSACLAVTLPDLSGYSYGELRELLQQTMSEMKSRPEWKSFEVPKGVWVIGEDIPAGSYSVKSVDSEKYTNVFLWGAEHRNFEKGGGNLLNESLYKEDNYIGKIILKDGNVLELSGAVILGPVQTFGF